MSGNANSNYFMYISISTHPNDKSLLILNRKKSIVTFLNVKWRCWNRIREGKNQEKKKRKSE